MLRKNFSSLRFVTLLLASVSSAVAIPECAWPADLRLKTKPIVREDTPSVWRMRLFEEFRRSLQQRNPSLSRTSGMPSFEQAKVGSDVAAAYAAGRWARLRFSSGAQLRQAHTSRVPLHLNLT